MARPFKNDEISSTELAILNQIEEINDLLVVAHIENKVSHEFYVSMKIKLLKLLDKCKNKFSKVYMNEKSN